jgi:HEAT repeat protein
MIQGRPVMAWRWWGVYCIAVLFLAHVPARPAAGATPLSNAGPVLDEMAKQLENRSLSVSERVQIVKTLGEWQTAQVRPPLVAALKDPTPEIREAAARALGWRGNNEATAPLRQLIETPGEPASVRAAAAWSLGMIGDASVRALVIALTQDPDAKIKEAALWGLALGYLGDRADRTTYLIQFAENRAFDPQARGQAIRVLAAANEERVVASLSRILETEPRLTVAVPTGQPTEQQIASLRHTQTQDVAAFAAGSLGRLEAKSALPQMLSAAEDPRDFFLRMNAVESLVAWNVPEAFPVFVRRLGDPLPEVRILALAGLEHLGDQKGVAPALGSLSDPYAMVRARAVTTVAKLGGSKVRPQLEALAKTEVEPEVMAALETALSQAAR